jgi:hypothetical protein
VNIMSERAEALAARFEQAVKDLAGAAEACSDAQWQANTGGGSWTVGASVHHVGAQFPLELEYLKASAEGATPPAYSWDDINGRNDARAAANSGVGKAEALNVLRDGAATMAAYVRALSDAQLDATAPLALAGGAAVSTQSLIEGGVLIDHAVGHLAEIRAAIA